MIKAFTTFLTSLLLVAPHPCAAEEQTSKPTSPNIIICVADDWGWPHAGAYGDKVVNTHAFDWLAKNGTLYTHAYVSSPSCTPSRNSILTGQQFYRLQKGANLFGALDKKFPNFMHLLADAGYRTGHYRKAWGPGKYQEGGYESHPCGPEINFDNFMQQHDDSKPFCFWFGTSDPHRVYKKGSGRKSGIPLDQITVPPFFPDTETVRSDIADYYFEVQRWDSDVMNAIDKLRKKGLLENTIIIMTGDHGMPFPRCKGNLYDWGTRVPLAIYWGKYLENPQQKSDTFTSLTDLSPTILDLTGQPIPKQMTGKSLRQSTTPKPGPESDFIVYGRERHTPAQTAPSIEGYPSRAIRTQDWLLILNLEPDRWPAGSPTNPTHTKIKMFADCDDSPTKSTIIAGKLGPTKLHYQLSFAKRPSFELYDCKNDPYQINNLANKPTYAETVKNLKTQLINYLETTKDPRHTQSSINFDNYPFR